MSNEAQYISCVFVIGCANVYTYCIEHQVVYRFRLGYVLSLELVD